MKTKLAVSIGLLGFLVASPAFANGFYCGGKDYNGCSVSPTTKRDCVKDLVGDIKDFKCDILDLVKDLAYSRNKYEIRKDVKELVSDYEEIQFDLAVLSSLGYKGK